MSKNYIHIHVKNQNDQEKKKNIIIKSLAKIKNKTENIYKKIWLKL